MPVIPLLSNAPHQTMGHNHPNSSIPMPPKLSLPTSQQLHHRFRHNPVNAKQSRHHKPQIKSKRAMDKEVVYWFPISFTHTTPIQNQNLQFPKIISIWVQLGLVFISCHLFISLFPGSSSSIKEPGLFVF